MAAALDNPRDTMVALYFVVRVDRGSERGVMIQWRKVEGRR
jgi:hypothetical protein